MKICNKCGSILDCIIGAYYQCPNGCDTIKTPFIRNVAANKAKTIKQHTKEKKYITEYITIEHNGDGCFTLTHTYTNISLFFNKFNAMGFLAWNPYEYKSFQFDDNEIILTELGCLDNVRFYNRSKCFIASNILHLIHAFMVSYI